MTGITISLDYNLKARSYSIFPPDPLWDEHYPKPAPEQEIMEWYETLSKRQQTWFAYIHMKRIKMLGPAGLVLTQGECGICGHDGLAPMRANPYQKEKYEKITNSNVAPGICYVCASEWIYRMSQGILCL